MYYLETKQTVIVRGKHTTTWKKLCYSLRREPLDEMVDGLGRDSYRVTPDAERSFA